jgi:hypothetical protein
MSTRADLLGLPGDWFLNGSYQGRCTTLAQPRQVRQGSSYTFFMLEL